jgi:hypothetical protein
VAMKSGAYEAVLQRSLAVTMVEHCSKRRGMEQFRDLIKCKILAHNEWILIDKKALLADGHLYFKDACCFFSFEWSGTYGNHFLKNAGNSSYNLLNFTPLKSI